MTAKIIQLNNYRRSSVVTADGVHFPTVYRISGYGSKLRPGIDEPRSEADVMPDPSFLIIYYSLDDDFSEYPAYTLQATAIEKPELCDRGWIIVRHHLSLDSASAYIAGITNATSHESDHVDASRMMWQTTEGIFTLWHRRVPRPWCRDCLLVYQTDSDTPITDSNGRLGDWAHIVAVNGDTFDTEDILITPNWE